MAAEKKRGQKARPYNFDDGYERAVVYLACTEPRFMGRTAHEVEPDLLKVSECKLALAAAQAIQRDEGNGSTSVLQVIQRVARLRDDGKLTQEQVREVAEYLNEWDDKAERPTVEAIEPELVHVIGKRLRHAIAVATAEDYNADTWLKVDELRAREERLGKADAGVGLVLTKETVKATIAKISKQKLIPYGIGAVDELVGGGRPNGTLTCFMAGPGGGKSMSLSHDTAQSSVSGELVAYATLELPPPWVMGRILACQSGMLINDLMSASEEAIDDVYKMFDCETPVVQDFPPHVTTVETLQEWVKVVEKQRGRKVDRLVVDYADKLTTSGKIDEKSGYQEMRIVYEKLRMWADAEAKSRQFVIDTASQSRARDEKKSKRVDIEHIADSMHKARVVDALVTHIFDPDTQTMDFFMAKYRYGEGRRSSGPVPCDYARGQVCPVERKLSLHQRKAVAVAVAASALGASANDTVGVLREALKQPEGDLPGDGDISFP